MLYLCAQVHIALFDREYIGWRVISYDYDKDLLREYHYSFFKCYESAQRTTDAKLQNGALFSVKGEWHIQRFWHRNLNSILDNENICGIEISQSFTC